MFGNFDKTGRTSVSELQTFIHKFLHIRTYSLMPQVGMELSKKMFDKFKIFKIKFSKKKKKKPRNLWKDVDTKKRQQHVTIPIIGLTSGLEVINEKNDNAIYMEDLEKRKEVYGICGECNEPGTGEKWCRPCNAKRFKENFKNWTSGNKDIDELLQFSQLNAVYRRKCLEWVPYEKLKDVTYIAEGGFGKIYLANWPEGLIMFWDIENQKWNRIPDIGVVLKSLNNSSKNISPSLLNEIKYHCQVHAYDVVLFYGMTRDPDTKNYMMVLYYCRYGNLRDYLNQPGKIINLGSKIYSLLEIANGLVDIHNAGIVHKDLHSGNILFSNFGACISDLGMCQPADSNEEKSKGNYGVLPYIAPEVLRYSQYKKASDIYSFGIMMNAFLSEETPHNDLPYDGTLAIEICKGFRPKISEDTPKLLADLIMKCWDAKAENRPTAKELCQVLKKWSSECGDGDYNKCDPSSEIYIQIKECEIIRLKNESDKNKSKNTQNHPQTIHTSRLLNFENIPEPVNASDLLNFNSDIDIISSASSECSDWLIR